MPYDSIVDRGDTQQLVPEEVSNILLENLQAESAALNLFRSIRMSTSQTRMPVLAALPTAYFVSGDTGLKQTTEQAWDKKFINVEELAAIVPIPENVLADTDFDLWGSIRPHLENAIARAIDNAIFFGVNKPDSWPAAIVPAAVAAGHTVNSGTSTAGAAGGLASDLSNVFAKVEEDGFDVDFVLAHRSYKGRLRNARNADGTPYPELQPERIYGVDVQYPLRGLWPAGSGAAEVIVGNRMEGIVGLRQDFTYKMLTEAVIQDSDGNIVYNLPQQDMVALRVTFRLGFQVANTIRYDNENAATRYPFAILRTP